MRISRTTLPLLTVLLAATVAVEAQKAGKQKTASGRTIPRTAWAACFTVW